MNITCFLRKCLAVSYMILFRFTIVFRWTLPNTSSGKFTKVLKKHSCWCIIFGPTAKSKQKPLIWSHPTETQPYVNGCFSKREYVFKLFQIISKSCCKSSNWWTCFESCHWVFSKCLALSGLKSKRNVPNKTSSVEHPHTNLQKKTRLLCTTSQVHSMYYGVYSFTYTSMYIPSTLPHGHVFQTKSKNTTMRVWRVREWQQL